MKMTTKLINKYEKIVRMIYLARLLNKILKRTRKDYVHIEDHASHYIVKNPVRCLSVALICGYFLGKSFAKKD